MTAKAPGRAVGGEAPLDGLDQGSFYRVLVDALSEAVLLYGSDGRVLANNASAERLLCLSGAQLRGQEPLPPGWRIFREDGCEVPFRTQESELPSAVALRTGRAQHNVLLRVAAPGHTRWLCTNAEPLFRPGERTPYAAVVSLTDTTEQRRTQEQLERQSAFRGSLIELVEASFQHGLDEAFYQHLLEGAVRVIPGAQAGSLLLRDEGGAYRFVAAVNFDQGVLSRAFLYEHELFRDPNVPGLQLIYGFDNSGILEPERRTPLYEAGDTAGIKVSMSIPVEMDGCAIAYFSLDNFDHQGAFDEDAIEMGRIFAHQVAALWQRFRLEAELRKERAALEHLAFYDPLTGLPNRALLHDRLSHALTQRGQDGRALAVMFLDLDDFKNVNDTLGHDAGDALLREVSRRVLACVRTGDTVARWGGDEFVLLLPGLLAETVASRVAREVLGRLSEPFSLSGIDVRVGASIGVALYPGLAATSEDLLKHADIALYRAKESGKNTYQFFTEEMNRRLQVRLSQGAELRGALAADALELQFEPRVDLRTLEVTAAEATVHWRHPERGLLGAETLLPLAEEAGLIGQLSEQVLTLACAQASAWARQGLPQRVSLTFSARGFRGGGVALQLARALRRFELGPDRLELGIGDLAALETAAGLAALRTLQGLGVGLSLAGFGVPGVPLGLLRNLPLSSVQIDRSFIHDLIQGDLTQQDSTREAAPDGSAEPRGDPLAASPLAPSLIKLVVALGQSLELQVIAKGVTTPFQHAQLVQFGCHEGQGPRFGPPQTAGAITSLLRRRYTETLTGAPS